MLMQACKNTECSDHGTSKCMHWKEHKSNYVCYMGDEKCPKCIPVAVESKHTLSTQQADIIAYNKQFNTGITQFRATVALGITNVAERVRELERMGYTFDRVWENNEAKRAKGERRKRWIRYCLISEPKN